VSRDAIDLEARITSDSHFGWIRTRLALERTLMAWVRTGVALIGFGFALVEYFGQRQGTESAALTRRIEALSHLGLTLIGAGVLAEVISGLQYWRMVRFLWSRPFRPLAGLEAKSMGPVYALTPVLAVVIVVTLIGVFAFFAVLLRMF
jgi:putative membrane protein